MSGIVYKLSCQNCSVNYIGESGRRLRDRMSEHKNDINNKKQNSNVYAHVRDFFHVFDFENVKIIDKSDKKWTRRKLEGIYTHLDSNAINRAWEPDGVYQTVI